MPKITKDKLVKRVKSPLCYSSEVFSQVTMGRHTKVKRFHCRDCEVNFQVKYWELFERRAKWEEYDPYTLKEEGE